MTVHARQAAETGRRRELRFCAPRAKPRGFGRRDATLRAAPGRWAEQSAAGYPDDGNDSAQFTDNSATAWDVEHDVDVTVQQISFYESVDLTGDNDLGCDMVEIDTDGHDVILTVEGGSFVANP